MAAEGLTAVPEAEITEFVNNLPQWLMFTLKRCVPTVQWPEGCWTSPGITRKLKVALKRSLMVDASALSGLKSMVDAAKSFTDHWHRNFPDADDDDLLFFQCLMSDFKLMNGVDTYVHWREGGHWLLQAWLMEDSHETLPAFVLRIDESKFARGYGNFTRRDAAVTILHKVPDDGFVRNFLETPPWNPGQGEKPLDYVHMHDFGWDFLGGNFREASMDRPDSSDGDGMGDEVIESDEEAMSGGGGVCG